MIPRCYLVVWMLLLLASVRGSSLEHRALPNIDSKELDANAVAQASRDWDKYWDDLDAASGQCVYSPPSWPSYQSLRANFPAAVHAFGMRCGKRGRLPPRLRESVAWFPDPEKRALVRAAIRHYAVGDPDTPFLYVLARLGTAEDMKRLQGFIRWHPDDVFLAEYMLECQNPYAHVALAEMIDVPGRWQESREVRTFLAELEKARPPRYVDLKWVGTILVILPAAVWLSARRRRLPSY